MKKYRTLNNVLSENEEALTKVTGHRDIARLLSQNYENFIAALRSKMPRQIMPDIDQGFIDYLAATTGGKVNEELRVIFVSGANEIIADEVISEGSAKEIFINARKIFKRAFDLCSSAVVLIHNHPSGNVQPSTQDVYVTRRLKSLGQELDVMILDHIIISGPNWFSFQRQRLI
jgi:DNA repair protein RadC